MVAGRGYRDGSTPSSGKQMSTWLQSQRPFTCLHACYTSMKKLKHSNYQIRSHGVKAQSWGPCVVQSYMARTHSASDAGASHYWRKEHLTVV